MILKLSSTGMVPFSVLPFAISSATASASHFRIVNSCFVKEIGERDSLGKILLLRHVLRVDFPEIWRI